MITESFSAPDYDFSDQIEKAARDLLPFGATQPEDSGISLPRRALINNDASSKYTVIEIQTVDRLGLLHELFAAVGRLGLSAAHARIATEKGAALDTLYLQKKDENEKGEKVEDNDVLDELQVALNEIVQAG